MVEHQSYLRAHIRDVWHFPTHILTVSYNEGRTEIADIVYTLKDAPSKPKVISDLPSIQTILSSLNHSIRGQVLFDTYQFLDLRDYLRKENTDDSRYLPSEWGISLRFEGEDCHENPDYPDSKGSILTVVNLYRDKLNDLTTGWQGELPFGISFEDNPADLKEKIPIKPIEWDDGDLEGYARWQFKDYALAIVFSTLMNYVAKIYIMPLWYDEMSEDDDDD